MDGNRGSVKGSIKTYSRMLRLNAPLGPLHNHAALMMVCSHCNDVKFEESEKLMEHSFVNFFVLSDDLRKAMTMKFLCASIRRSDLIVDGCKTCQFLAILIGHQYSAKMVFG